jgi:Tol biopolymer transport system component
LAAGTRKRPFRISFVQYYSQEYLPQFCGEIMKCSETVKHSVTGVVVASRWTRDGNINGISVQGYDQKEYIVKLNRCGKELLKQIKAQVRIVGKIVDRLDGRRIVQVEHYDILDTHAEN